MMICKKCGKHYDNTWKVCLTCREHLIYDPSAEGMIAPASDPASNIANPRYYLKQFKKFDENNGRFCFTWNWSAAFFNWIWQFYRGLWAKWIVYAIAFSALTLLVQYLPIEFFMARTIGLWAFSFIFFGSVSNYDYYLKKNSNENLWPFFPYAKFKAVFWALVLLTVGVWTFYTVQNMQMMNRVMQGMRNPVLVTGETYETDGIKYTLTKGWSMIEQPLPQIMPGIRIRNEKIFLISKISEGVQKPINFGQVGLYLGWPKKGERFESLEQKEVKKMVEMSFAQKGLMPMPFKRKVSEPEYIEINGRQWLKTHYDFGSMMNLTYYTIGADRLVIVVFSGVSTSKGWVADQLETFADTFEFAENIVQ